MKIFWKGIASLLFYLIAAALLTYTAARSLHFIQSTLAADQQIMGFLALAATSGGVLAWLLVFLHSAEGMGQKIISSMMVVTDLFGEFGLFAFDTLLTSGEAGIIARLAPGEIQMVIVAMSTLIFANILATVGYHLFDNENLKTMREQFVKSRLEDEAMKLIEKR